MGKCSLELILQLALRRVQAQEELQLLNESLEQRVAERTAVAEQRSAQLRLLASELTMAENRERQRLALVLHDGLQQTLAGAKSRLATIERSTEKRNAISEVASIIDQAIETSRSLTAELSPPILYQSGLFAGLQWLARWMQEKHGLEVQLDMDETANPMAQEITVLVLQVWRLDIFPVRSPCGCLHSYVHLNPDRCALARL